MGEAIDINLTLIPSDEAKICLDCTIKKCKGYYCKRYRLEMEKLKEREKKAKEKGITWERD